MSRSHRGVILAAVGWLILAATVAPDQSDQPKNTDAEEPKTETLAPVAVSISRPVEIVQRPEEAPPCGPGQYESNDDLCAQWKAADSAAVSAQYSCWSLVIAFVGTVGVLFSLYYTRKAVLAAEDATRNADAALAIAGRTADAAAKQARIAQEASEATQRPWVSVRDLRVEKYEIYSLANEVTGGDVKHFLAMTFAFTAENTGPMPAHDVYVRMSLCDGDLDIDIENLQESVFKHSRFDVMSCMLPPGAATPEMLNGHVAVTPRPEGTRGGIDTSVVFAIRYRFGERNFTTSHVYFVGSDTGHGTKATMDFKDLAQHKEKVRLSLQQGIMT